MTLFWLLITSWCTKIGFQAMMLIRGHNFLCLYLPWIFLSFQQGLIWPKASTHNFYGCRGRQAFWHMLCRVITNLVSGTQLCWGCCSLSQTLHGASGCWRCSPPCSVSTLPSLTGPNHQLLLPLPFLGISSPGCWAPAPATPVPHVQVAPGGHASCCVNVQLRFGKILEVAPYKGEDGGQIALSAWLTLLASQVIH